MEENKNRLLIIGLGVFCVLCVILVWSTFRHLRNIEFEFNEKKATLVKENLDLKDRIESLEEIVSQKTDEIIFLGKDKEVVNEKLILIKKEHKELSKAYSKLRLDYSNLTSESKEMSEQLEDLRADAVSLSRKISELEGNPLLQRIKDAAEKEENEMIKKVLEDTARNIELIKAGKSIELKPIVVVGEESGVEEIPAEVETKHPISSKATMAKILSVDIVNNLAVIDAGRNNKVKEGYRCTILKDKEKIAYGDVISVRYNISAVYINEIKYKSSIMDIKEGNRVLITEE